MKENKSFYDVFLEECQKSTLVVNSYVTENQKISVRDNAKFLNQIDASYHSKIAREIITILEDYNRRTDSNEYHVINNPKHNDREKEIKIIKKFLDILHKSKRTNGTKNLRPITNYDLIEKLQLLTETFLSITEDLDQTMYIKKTRSSKSELSTKINELIKQYNIQSASREAKKFIDNLDYPYNDWLSFFYFVPTKKKLKNF